MTTLKRLIIARDHILSAGKQTLLMDMIITYMKDGHSLVIDNITIFNINFMSMSEDELNEIMSNVQASLCECIRTQAVMSKMSDITVCCVEKIG